LVARIEKLAGGRCFEIIEGASVEAKNGLSLRTYWEDGGFDRLRSALALGGKGKRLYFTEPDVRRALTLETAPKSPIAAMLCPAADEACGAETAGWELRVEALFELAACSRCNSRDCEKAARAAPRSSRFDVWRGCLEESDDDVAPRISLPIGRTRAPRQGWFVIKGRRGHYDFCDEVRAYDLATGSAYLIGSCSGLALENDGSVNAQKTNAARKPVVTIGHLPLDQLREAAWMALLIDELDIHVRIGTVGMEVPAWIEVRRDTGAASGGSFHGTGSISTAQTDLDWEVLGAERLRKQGSLVFPDHDDVAKDHAIRLLRIAELGLKPGCPEARPPTIPTSSALFKDLWAKALAQQAACRSKR
jgi:hypothetical protein